MTATATTEKEKINRGECDSLTAVRRKRNEIQKQTQLELGEKKRTIVVGTQTIQLNPNSAFSFRK